MANKETTVAELTELFRGSNAVGYSNYPDNVVAGFVKHSADSWNRLAGVLDLHRAFDQRLGQVAEHAHGR